MTITSRCRPRGSRVVEQQWGCRLPAPSSFVFRGTFALPATAWSLSAHEAGPGFALGPEEIKGKKNNDDEHGIQQFFGAADESVKGKNVDNDRAQREQAEISRPRYGHENATNQFDDFDKFEIAGFTEGAEEHSRGSPFGR